MGLRDEFESPYTLQMVLLCMSLILVMSLHKPCLFPMFTRFPNSLIIFFLLGNSLNLVLHDSHTGRIVGTARKVGRLFELIFLHLPCSLLSASVVSGQRTYSLSLWHSRLGHASISRVKQLVSRGLLGLVSNKSFDCMPCQFDK